MGTSEKYNNHAILKVEDIYPTAVYAVRCVLALSVLVCQTAVYIHYWHTQLSCTPGIEPYVPKGCVH